MNITWDNIIKYITDHYSANTILIIVIAIIIILLMKYGQNFISGIKNTEFFKRIFPSKKCITQKDLENHYIFTHIKYLRGVKINLLNFGDDARNYIVRLLLKHKLNRIELSLKEFIRLENLNDIPPDQLEILLKNVLYDTITLYIEDFKKEAHTKEEQDIINVVIEKLWSTYEEEMLSSEGIKDVIMSPIYDGNIIKIHSLLLPIIVSIESFLIRTEQNLSNLNGKLSGKSFHGFIFK